MNNKPIKIEKHHTLEWHNQQKILCYRRKVEETLCNFTRETGLTITQINIKHYSYSQGYICKFIIETDED